VLSFVNVLINFNGATPGQDLRRSASEDTFSAKARVLDHKLEHRPDRTRLVETNIMKGSRISGVFVVAQLKFGAGTDATTQTSVSDRLEHHLDVRPTREELVDVNIIRGSARNCIRDVNILPLFIKHPELPIQFKQHKPN
jgi:hypothetical protein